MAFAAYFCDLTNFIVQEGDPNAPQVELLLRALYLLSRVVTNPTPTQNAEFEKIKAVFEFRSLTLDGRLPDMSCCGGCGKLDGLHFLSPLDGNCGQNGNYSDKQCDSRRHIIYRSGGGQKRIFVHSAAAVTQILKRSRRELYRNDF